MEHMESMRKFMEKCSDDLRIPEREKVLNAICDLCADMYKLGYSSAMKKVINNITRR